MYRNLWPVVQDGALAVAAVLCIIIVVGVISVAVVLRLAG